jgi:hypothetical protein
MNGISMNASEKNQGSETPPAALVGAGLILRLLFIGVVIACRRLVYTARFVACDFG